MRILRPNVHIFKLAFFMFLSSAAVFGEDDKRALSSDECGKLYTHQLKVHIDDGLLSPVISSQKSSLEADGALEIAYCRKNINYSNYKCQMGVRSVIALHECHRMHGGPAAQKKEKVAAHKKIFKNKKETIPDLESAISKERPGKVSPNECGQAYSRLLVIFRDSPNLKNNPDKDRMVTYWNSDEAKTSFSNRCVRVYRPSDISCIMKGKDRDSLQACLLQVPAE